MENILAHANRIPYSDGKNDWPPFGEQQLLRRVETLRGADFSEFSDTA
jgi:hypothetical protein